MRTPSGFLIRRFQKIKSESWAALKKAGFNVQDEVATREKIEAMVPRAPGAKGVGPTRKEKKQHRMFRHLETASNAKATVWWLERGDVDRAVDAAFHCGRN